MDAIVYTSNTGFTAQYAELLRDKTGLTVYSLRDAQEKLPAGAEVIYMGWLMGGIVKGLKKAARRYTVRAVCGVGMGATGGQTEDVRKANFLTPDMPLFTLQGGFDRKRLHGVYKLMMNIAAGAKNKELAAKPDKTAEETDMYDLMINGGSRVRAENLSQVLAWYESC